MAPGKDTLTITVVGAGNVGTHLAMKLHHQGYPINQVFSRKRAKAKALADKCGAEAISELGELNLDSDLFLFAVPDDSLEELAGLVNLGEKVAAHTSGAAASDLLRHATKFCGVVYPMQSFTRTAETPDDFPVIVHSPVETVGKILAMVARSLTKTVLHLDDRKRLLLHVAAVFVNNFPNHLYALAEQLTASAGVDFDVMYPLMRETTRKAQSEPPSSAQTGPAKRSDFRTIQAHLDLLSDRPFFKDIYLALTESIIDTEKNRAQS
jgi:predicted short-subunit dehydrogenase-like oxidoreductase (DUF2520 family)